MLKHGWAIAATWENVDVVHVGDSWTLNWNTEKAEATRGHCACVRALPWGSEVCSSGADGNMRYTLPCCDEEQQ